MKREEVEERVVSDDWHPIINRTQQRGISGRKNIGKTRFKAVANQVDGLNLPVSYTHLDVYKRQMLGVATFFAP